MSIGFCTTKKSLLWYAWKDQKKKKKNKTKQKEVRKRKKWIINIPCFKMFQEYVFSIAFLPPKYLLLPRN